jgi:DNA-binding transcriptional LysR family regulator
MTALIDAGSTSMFELSQVRCFIAVAEELHFGRAAARLNLTQPPLSRQIQILERILDATLLERTSRSVKLTPAGRNFLQEARRIVELAERSVVNAKRSARGETGSIALGCTAAASYALLPRLVTFARTRLPGVSLALKEMVTADQVEALTAGRLDMGLVRRPFSSQELGEVCILREPLLLAAPRGHPHTRGPSPAVIDLDRQPLVMWSPVEARYFHDLVTGLCAMVGAAPAHVQYISQTHTMLALVGARLGLALVPEAARALRFRDVVLRPLRAPSAVAELHLVWRRDNTNPAMALFRDAVIREFVPSQASLMRQADAHASSAS